MPFSVTVLASPPNGVRFLHLHTRGLGREGRVFPSPPLHPLEPSVAPGGRPVSVPMPVALQLQEPVLPGSGPPGSAPRLCSQERGNPWAWGTGGSLPSHAPRRRGSAGLLALILSLSFTGNWSLSNHVTDSGQISFFSGHSLDQSVLSNHRPCCWPMTVARVHPGPAWPADRCLPLGVTSGCPGPQAVRLVAAGVFECCAQS